MLIYLVKFLFFFFFLKQYVKHHNKYQSENNLVKQDWKGFQSKSASLIPFKTIENDMKYS